MPFQVQERARWRLKPVRLAVLLSFTIVASVFAADPREYAVEISVTLQSSPFALQLSWPSSSIARQYTIKRRSLGGSDWGAPIATLPGTATGYTDSSANNGTPYEYEVQMESTVPANGGWMNAYGYLYAGANVPPAEFKGKALLLVESSVAPALANELATFQSDLIGSGWTVARRDVSRSASPSEIKGVIRDELSADPFNLRSVILIGHVPVPYSGNIAPDLHESHRGAWPADVYYGELDGPWTDDTVNVISFDNEDNDNRPGDGKFDQSQIPSPVELEVGRIDFWNMPAFGPRTEVDLLRTYFRKNHEFRHRAFTAERRGLIRDNFGDLDGDAPAVDAWRHYPQFFGPGKINEVGTGQFFPTLNSQSYLWAYACGGGGYLKADGVGTTYDFAANDPKAVFLILHGSYFGDWNNTDNFLRAAVATPNHTLASIWSGLPHWFMHPMALGTTIGYCTKLTQNNVGNYKSHQNFSANQVHISLIGDPTLEMFPVVPPSNLRAEAGGSVVLNWDGAAEENLVGYNVYHSTSAAGPHQKLNTEPVTGTFYSHSAGEGTHHYMVRALKLERTGSGTFYNLSQGAFATVTQGPGGGGPKPSVSITAVDSEAGESARNRGEFRITRSAVNDSPLVVEYLIGGTAGNGVDYEVIPNSVMIQPGSGETSLAIVPIIDPLTEGEETVTIQLRTTSAYTLGSPSVGFLRIQDAVAVNQPPAVLPIPNQSMPANGTLIVNFQVSDPDTALGDLTLRATSSNAELVPPAGLVLGGSGADRTIQIVPAPGESGVSTITVLASDGQFEAGREFQLTVMEEENAAPTADAQTITTFRGTPVTLTLSGSDPESAPLSFSIETDPALGTLSGTPPTLTYTPGGDAVGEDSFLFVVNDGERESSPAEISIVILETNRPPSALPQSIVTPEDTRVGILVEGADSDGDLLEYEIVTGPAHGSLSGRNASYVYAPGTNFFGSDRFTFRVSDGSSASAAATVSIEITPVNDAPRVAGATIQVDEDQATPVTLIGTDVENDAIEFEVVTPPLKGQLSGTAPNLVFTPALNVTGSDSFTFRARDAGSASVVATINLVIVPANDPPVALDQLLSTAEEVPVAVPIGGSDPDGDAVTFRVMTAPAKGSLSGVPPNLFYTPAPNASGSDSFTFVLNDGKVDSVPATISIEIERRNDPPTISSISPQFGRKNAAVGPLALVVQDLDRPASELILTGGSSHSNIVVPGQITFSGNGTNRTISIQPETGAAGTTIITITVSDGEAQAETSFLLTLTNTAPEALPDVAASFGGTILIPLAELFANDSDPDGDPLQLASVSQSELGLTLVLTNGGIIYPGAPGGANDSFDYTVQDNSGATAKATVTIAVAQSPRIEEIEMNSDGVVLRVSGIPNALFRVQRSSDARAWNLVGEGTTGTDGRASFRDEEGASAHHRFYRIEWP